MRGPALQCQERYARPQPVCAVGRQVGEGLPEELGELPLRHFARGHGELPVLDPAQATHMPVDWHVVGRVHENHLGTLAGHEAPAMYKELRTISFDAWQRASMAA